MSSKLDTAVERGGQALRQSPSATEGASASIDPLAAERVRAAGRRAAMEVVRPVGHEHAPWALAFSGGGIRSATFCLGALQGLAHAQPTVSALNTPSSKLLMQFDYLSTVSGGGYIGGFFTSLFCKNRLNQDGKLDDKATARQAYQVFAEDPPGRLRGDVRFEAARPGVAPLAWLRENGRYLAPTGTGDLFYAGAIAVRNWCALHFVWGTMLLALYLLLAFAHVFVMASWNADFCHGQNHALGLLQLHHQCLGHEMQNFEISLLRAVVAQEAMIWWSPAWWLMFPLLMLWLVPSGVAFWMTHPPLGGDLNAKPRHFSKAAVCALIVSVALLVFAWVVQPAVGAQWKPLGVALFAFGYLVMAGVIWHWLTCALAQSISAQRVMLVRALAKGFRWGGALALFAAVHTTAQTLYTHVGRIEASLSSAGAVAVLVWIVRRLASAFEEKEREGWLRKIPFNAIVSAAGLSLLFLVALFWALVVLWIQWRGAPPNLDLLKNTAEYWSTAHVLGICLLLTLGLATILGRFPGFLNLSTLNGLYSARLTRAYLGASNGARFKAGPDNIKLRSVAQPAPGDHVTPEAYFQNALAPMHIINICMNQNSDPAEQLIQRDRKGKPLAILPSGFMIDGWHHRMPDTKQVGAISASLTIGEWIGVSGAAIATGMGRDSGLSRALLNGLANLRLGRWWESGVLTEPQTSASRRLRQLFKTQTYLFDELFGRFHGQRRPLHYLSDGGHFENTALYELLRPERGIRLMVACDCGCDPRYQFADLANLIRLARIDFGSEIEVDRKIANDEVLGMVFGTPEQFLPDCKDPHAAQKCALLLKVYRGDASRDAQQPDARIILIKPRVTPDLGADLAQYRAVHAAFPQEPTADQFYDEAQWESYRKLGLELTKTVFGVDDDAYREALWSWCADLDVDTNVS